MLLFVGGGRRAGMFFKGFDKISSRTETCFPRNGMDGIIRGNQVFFGCTEAAVGQVLMKCPAGVLLHQLAQIIGMVAKILRNGSVIQIRILIMGVDIFQHRLNFVGFCLCGSCLKKSKQGKF